MNKEFVPYEESLALKELGFDDEVLKVYDINSSKSELYNYGEVLTGDDELYAPLYQQAFRWLYQKLSIENGTMPLNTETQQLLLKELIDKVSSKHLLV